MSLTNKRSAAGAAGTFTISLPIADGAGNSRIVVGWMTVKSAAGNGTGMTYNGVAGTALGAINNATGRIFVYYWDETIGLPAAAGTYNLVLVGATGIGIIVQGYSVSNARQGAPTNLQTATSDGGSTGTSVSFTASAPVGSDVMAILNAAYTPLTPGGTQTVILAATSDNGAYAASGYASDSLTASYSWGATVDYTALSFAIEPAAAAGPTLSAGTPANGSTVGSAVSLGCTTSDGSAGTNTLYGVLATSNIFTGVTGAQVKAGQNAAGNSTGVTATNAAITTTTPSISQGTLASGTYYAAIVQEKSGNLSNVINLTFTVDADLPTFSAGPLVSAIGSTTANITVTSSETGTVAVIANTSNPGNTAFDAAAVAITANVSSNVSLSGLTPMQLTNFWVQIKDAAGNRATDNVSGVTLHASFTNIIVTTPNSSNVNIIETDPPISNTDIISYGNVQGTGNVVVYSDCSFNSEANVTSFDVFVANSSMGYGAKGTQYVPLVYGTKEVSGNTNWKGQMTVGSDGRKYSHPDKAPH